jgi:hypothetical protein
MYAQPKKPKMITERIYNRERRSIIFSSYFFSLFYIPDTGFDNQIRRRRGKKWENTAE